MVLVVLAMTACGGARPPAAPAPGTTGADETTHPLGELFLLENSGPQPGDTSVRTPVGVPRTLVLRHAFPDQTVFAAIHFDSAAFVGAAGPEVTIAAVALPGQYGVTLTTSQPFSQATLTFYYAVHFLMPSDARGKYSSPIEFEKAVAIGRSDGTSVTFLPTRRPATDLLETTIRSAGTFVVAAVR